MTVNYFQFIPCCQGGQILFFSGDPDLVPNGVYEYQGQCYTVVYIFDISQEVLDPIPVDELIVRSDCNQDECLCCQCVRVRSRAILPAPVGLKGIDCSGNIQGISIPADGSWSENLCLRSWVIDEKQFEVEIIGDCIDNQCPTETCFLLEDCEGNQEDIYATYASMSDYLDHTGTIKIDGFPDTCWTFREVDTCECAIEVTVLSTWADCDECINCKGYKLTNCEDGTVRYTTNDLALYVDKAVELEDCPGCWLVTCLEEYPPNDQNLVVEFEFDSCEDCAKNFYKLTPCAETPDEDPIFTDTDLSAYLGFVIHLDGIQGTCWTIEEVRDLEGNSFQTVFLDEYYEDCPTCVVDNYDCQCSSAVNSWPVAVPLSYLDCNGQWQTTDPVLPGQRSERVCVVRWRTGIPSDTPESDIEYYGNCTSETLPEDENGIVLTVWECPVVTPRLRSVRPGYNTPGCPPDYFEKVSCEFAESLYKDVLADRYGITTNCSDDDFRKWEIKKELLDMAAITNPDYDCPPVSGCYDPCAPTGLELCTSRCHQYTVTIPDNAPDQDIVYTACGDTETTTISHTLIDTPTVYTICIQGGTPITTTDGVIAFVDECTP